MNILITGASGFLGKEIYSYLKESCNIDTIGRSRESTISLDLSLVSPKISKKYDLVVHAAGKAHSLPKTKKEEEEFFNVNCIGTKNLLKGLKNNLPKTLVFISTVAVYGLDFGEMIDENSLLLGSTPYAKSKILAEEEIVKFSHNNNINYLILRLPLISGNNPPGNLGSMMRAIKKGYYFRIGKGEAKKSIVSANDIAKLIASIQTQSGIYNLTDGIDPMFNEIENHIANLYDKKILSFNKWFFILLAKIGDLLPFFIINTNKLSKITNSLTFSSKKACKDLGWKPESALNNIKN